EDGILHFHVTGVQTCALPISNFSAIKQSKYYFYSSLWGALGSILFNFLLIPIYGLQGAAMSVVLSYAVMAISRIKYSWQFVQIRSEERRVGEVMMYYEWREWW